MGAGPLQQPFLEGGSAGDAAPSAPPLAGAPPAHAPPGFAPPPGLVQRGATPYAAAGAPPTGSYPPYEEQQRGLAGGGGGGGSYVPPALHPPQLQLQPQPLPQPQQQPYMPPRVVESTTVIYERPVIQRMGPAPVLQICPACGQAGPTRVRREHGCCTWLQCFGMCWLFCPLFWLPCCLDCSKDLVHRCGHCGAEVARVQPCT